ncbi:hypothetical protein NXV46_06550 [Bacteroides thetaiotaomicron]|nr:hypothetical protein NXV46_06550 [Bacteroides thetaiotaomicron]
MKTTTPNPVFAKIRLYLRILASCVIVTCLFLIIIHPEGMDYSGLHYRSYDLPIISSDTIQTQRVEEMKEISDHIMRL